MKFDAFVANRYLRAKRKQTFIGVISLVTLIGITLGVAGLNIALAIHNGMREAFVKNLIGETGQLYITAGQFRGGAFNKDEVTKVAQILSATPGVTDIAMLRDEPAVIFSEQRRMRYATIKGVIPEQFNAVSNTLQQLESGSLIDLERRPPGGVPGIVMGKDLAASLGVYVGAYVRVGVPRLASPGLSRQGLRLKELKCQVVATFATGNSQFDDGEAYILLENLQILLNTRNIKSLIARFDSIKALDAVKQDLAYHPDLPDRAVVVDFRDFNQKLFQALRLEKMATTAVISLFVLIVALNMISALIMLVMEKHRDIGIMKSFGVPKSTILKIFLRQGVTLSLMGTALGTLLGVGVSIIADRTQLIKMDNAVYEVLNYLPFSVQAWEVVLVALGSLVLSTLSSLYPAKQAADLDPVQALKYD